MSLALPRLAALSLGLLGLTAGPACGKHRHDVVTHAGPPRGAPASIAIAPTMLFHADQLSLAPEGAVYRARSFTPEHHNSPPLPPPDDQQKALLDVFYANLYVGKIWHSGGYDLLPEVGNQVRSLGLSLSLQQSYAEQVQTWTDQAIGEVLTEREQPWTRVADSVEAAMQPPRRSLVRGTQALDGEDNQNLPHFTLEPLPLDPAALPAGIAAEQLLVPIVVHYYAHNGGWFVGQAKGCPSGARFRLLWALHDVETGAVVTWADISTRYVQPYFYKPNDVQLQDYLLQVEALMREELVESLLP